MRFAIASIGALLFLSATALAGGEGGADYGQPFTAGAALDDGGAANPLATVSVIELRGEDLVAMGALNAADALSFATGCFVYQADRWSDRGEQLLRLRGAGPVGFQVIVDGVPIQHGVYGTTALQEIPADQIARLRVYPGPAPALLGAEGGAGVVEIVTRRAGEKFTAGFDARFGNHRQQDYAFGAGDTYQGFQAFAAADHQGLAGEALPADYQKTRNEEGGVRNGSGYSRDHYRIRLGAATEPADAHVSFFYDSDDRDVPYNEVEPLGERFRFPRQDRVGGVANVRLGAFGPFNLDGDAYIFEAIENQRAYADESYNDYLNQRNYHDVRTGGSLTPWFDIGRWSRLALRAEYLRDNGEFYATDALPRAEFVVGRLSGEAEDDLNPASWLNISLGGGAEQVDPSKDQSLPPGKALTASHGRAGLAFGPFGGVTIRGAAGVNPQFPTVEQWFDYRMGNPRLKAESIENGEAAIDYQPVGGTKLTATGYWRRERHGIDLAARPAAGEFPIFANIVDRDVRGLTLAAVSRPIPGLYLSAWGSFYDIYDDTARRYVWSSYAPGSSAAADVRYRFWFGLGAAAQLLYANERWDYDVLDTAPSRMSAYSVVNARIFYAYRDLVEVYVAGANLFDVAYETKRYYPAPGRTLTGGLRLMY